MPDVNRGDSPAPPSAPLRDALRRLEADAAQEVPAYDAVWSRIASSPSPMEAPGWGAARSLRVAGLLVWAQFRVVPWLVVPAALAAAVMATLTARVMGSGQGAAAATTGFASVTLLGVVATITIALSTRDPDVVTVATPVGPSVVLFARVAMVLVVDVLAGLVSSAATSAWGAADAFGPVVSGWLVPLAAVAGVATFLAVWIGPWVGALGGVLAIPLLVPPPTGSAQAVGVGAVAGAIREAVPAVGVVGLGCLLLGSAVLVARRALLSAADSS